MNHRRRVVALGTRTLFCALPLTGCGDYDPPSRSGAGGTAGETSTAGAAGSTQTAAGSGGQTGMGGSSLASGSGGSGSFEVTPVEASCEAVVPCGGDIFGTWTVAGSCLPISGMADMAGFGLGCTAAPVTGRLDVSGRWTANVDGTFTDQTTTSGDAQLELPPECLMVSGFVTTCDRVGDALEALGYATVVCTNAASGGGCSCEATAAQAGGLAMLVFGPAASGTYTTADNVVTTSAANGTMYNYAYCVSGNTLVMTPTTPNRIGTMTGTIAFEKP